MVPEMDFASCTASCPAASFPPKPYLKELCSSCTALRYRAKVTDGTSQVHALNDKLHTALCGNLIFCSQTEDVHADVFGSVNGSRVAIPFQYITNSAAPFLTIQGQNDTWVMVDQSVEISGFRDTSHA